MADLVRENLEGMTIELNVLKKHGVFSASEVRSIVRRRTNFEYRITRKAPEKINFLRYLRFEISLERLRQRRIAKLDEDGEKSHKLRIIEFGGIRHIHFIFTRALRKFAGDVKLWAQYLEFCIQSNSTSRLSEAFARALRLHPRESGLWILAAQWEYERNCDTHSARSILQRAIRINPNSRQLYLEYAKLELLYVEKVRERLALASEDGGIKSLEDQPAEKTAPIELPDAPKDSEDAEMLAPKEEDEEDLSSFKPDSPFFKYAIPKIVIESALEKIPEDLELSIQFLRLLSAFEGSEEIQDLVIRSMEERFPTKVESWTAIAHHSVSRGGSKVGASVFERALAMGPPVASAELWEAYAEYVRAQVTLDLTALDAAQASKQVSQICTRAEAANQISPRLYLWWMSALANMNASEQTEKEVQEIAKRASQKFPRSSLIWSARMEINPTDEALAKAALKSLEGADCLVAAKKLTQMLAAKKGIKVEELVKPCTEAMAKVPIAERGSLKEMVIEIASGVGPAMIREVIDWAIGRAWTGVGETSGFCRACISALTSTVPAGKAMPKEVSSRIRRVYDRVLSGSTGATDTDLWIELLRFERTHGDSKSSANVYSRAKASLKDCSEFVARVSMLSD